MVEISTSPKRKASVAIESPSKRGTWTIDDDLEQKVLRVPSNTPDRIIISETHPIHAGATWQSLGRREDEISPVLHIESVAAPTKCEDRGDTVMEGVDSSNKLTPPPAEEGHKSNAENGIFPIITRKVKRGQDYTEITSTDDTVSEGSSQNETRKSCASNDSTRGSGGSTGSVEEIRIQRSPREYVALQISVSVVPVTAWAKVIHVSGTYNGVEVASASGHLIYRELIRGDFYNCMEMLGKPTSNRIDELLDHHGYFRWSIKEYYLRNGLEIWDDGLDIGSILQIDEVLINKEWQHHSLGFLIVNLLISRAERSGCGAKLAFALPSAGSFWNVVDAGTEELQGGEIWAEHNDESFFLGAGFTRVAASSWFVLDVTAEDTDDEN